MANVELVAPFARIKGMIPDDWKAVYQYNAILRGGRVTHQWCLSSEKGAIHIHGCLSALEGLPTEWLGGIETHLPHPFDYGSQDTPSHDHCWLLQAPCWHDGTSLGFSENVAPYLPETDDLKSHHHEMVVNELRRWFQMQIMPPVTEDA